MTNVMYFNLQDITVAVVNVCVTVIVERAHAINFNLHYMKFFITFTDYFFGSKLLICLYFKHLIERFLPTQGAQYIS